MTGRELQRLLSLILRDLQASDVRIAEGSDPLPVGDGTLLASLPGGRTLVVELPPGVTDVAPLQRRLEVLVASFQETWHEESPEGDAGKPSHEEELTELLRDVVAEAGAIDAVVIDADSPMVWASAASGHGEAPGRAVLTIVKDEDSQPGDPPGPELLHLSKRAISIVRGLPELDALHRGGHLNHTVREADLGLVARSFASLYLLVLVYDAPFDQLAAERALGPALPVIERLVLALPPPDPSPSVGVAAMRPRRRR